LTFRENPSNRQRPVIEALVVSTDTRDEFSPYRCTFFFWRSPLTKAPFRLDNPDAHHAGNRRWYKKSTLFFRVPSYGTKESAFFLPA